MKKIYFSLLLFFISLISASAQTTYESIFDTSGSTSWKRITEICNLVDAPYFNIDSLYTNGDTIIQNRSYRKLFSTFFAPGDVDKNVVTGLLGYLHESANHDSLWYLAYHSQQTTTPAPLLVMNLSLTAGSTFSYNSLPYMVDSVKQENNRKVLYMSYGCQNRILKFVEGIGPSFAFPFDRTDKGAPDWLNEAVCVWKNGQHVYTYPTFWNMHAGGVYDCVLNAPTGGGVQETGGNAIKLSPNPVGNMLSIETTTTFTGTVQIIQFNGQLVSEKHIINETHILVPFEQYVPGSYFIRLTDAKGNTGYARFIKQ